MVSDMTRGFFPYSVVREGQEELMQDLERAMQEQKILLGHAPTGLGKTASSLAVAVAYALEKKKVVFFLTNRHTQHYIAVETLKGMQKMQREKSEGGTEIRVVDLIGKRGMCSQSVAELFGNEFNEYCKAVVEKSECEFYNSVYSKKSLTVDAKSVIKKLQARGAMHVEELKTFLEQEKMCSYEIALALAKEATVVIGDYYYLFHPHVQDTILTKLGKELEDIIVIVDEGHNLPSRMMDMMSNTLSSVMIKNGLIEAKKYRFEGMLMWLQELMRILTDLADFNVEEREKERKVEKIEFVQRVKMKVDYDELINELEMAADEIRKKQRRSYLGGIAAFLNAWMGEDEGYVRSITEKSSKFGPVIALNYACLDPRVVTRDIFARVHAGVVMSGTLQPLLMYKDILGIGGKAMLGEYRSPFPVENKLTIIVPETSTKYTLRGSGMYQLIAQKCSEMISLIPGNVALFFPSYDLRDEICRYLTGEKKRFWEKQEMSKEEKETLLILFKEEKERGGVLLGVTGANFAEGIDFPGDLLQGVIVIGLPLARPDLKTREMIAYYDAKFGRGWDYGYTYPALNKCFQSAGRCIRSETDRGAVIYLDERFSWQNYFMCFPREGVRVSRDYGQMLRDFFGRK